MSENCTHDCSTCGANCSHRGNPESFKAEANPLSSVKRVVAVVSGKGGVGKSMVTSLLAVALQRSGLKAGILDADITGPSIPKAFGLTEKAMGNEDGLYPVVTRTGIDVMSLNLLLPNDDDPVVWRGPVIGGTVKQFWTEVVWKDIDVLLVDMPPGTGDVPLTVFQSLPIDGIVIVTSPQELVSMIVGKAVNMAKLMNIPILGLVENMSYYQCPHCGEKLPLFGESKLEDVAAQYGVPVLGRLPIDPKLAAACDNGLIEMAEVDLPAEAIKAAMGGN